MSDMADLQQMLRSLPPEALAGLRAAARRGLDALRKPEQVSGAVWAHRHFYLSAESSQREEKWVAWPYQIGWLDAMADDRIREVTIFKSARLGYTKCLLSDLARTAEHTRRNQCLWLPTDGDVKDFCKTDLDPMLEDVAVMRRVFPKVLQRSKDNSLEQKKFIGSLLKLRGGKASGNYRRLTIATGRADELDGFELSVEGAGTPDGLIRKRVEGATFSKLIWGSTGRRKGLSHIERLYQAMDVRMKFHIVCPHCGVDHPLAWGGPKVRYGFKWDAENPAGTVRHHCHHCHGAITQAEYLRLARTGFWRSECGTYTLRHWWNEAGEPQSEWTDSAGMPCLPPERVGFHAWTAYTEAAGVTWGALVLEVIEAAKAMKIGNKEPMVQVKNETLGETWEDEGESADVNDLQTRARSSGFRMRQVPVGASILVAAVDVQDNRFEVMVQAVGRGEIPQVWVIDYLVIDANPALMSDWDRLWDALQQQYQHRHGAWLSISGAAVDTGGHYTQQAYTFVAKYQHAVPDFRLFAIKGSSQDGDPIVPKAAKPVDISLKGKVTKKGVKLWMVGTDTAKDLWYGMLKVTQPGPGAVHFAEEQPREYFAQYGNEKRLQVRVAGKTTYRWVHTSGANEVVDLSGYCLFVIHAMQIPRFSPRKWEQLEARVAPDLFAAIDDAPGAPPAGAVAQLPEPANPISPAHPPAPAAASQPQRPRPAARPPASAPPAHPGLGSNAWRGRL